MVEVNKMPMRGKRPPTLFLLIRYRTSQKANELGLEQYK